MKTLLKIIERCENAGAFLAALALVLMFALGLAEIVMRSFFGASIPVSLEYSGYLVAFSFLMGAGWTLREGKHVRVTLLELGGKRGRLVELAVTAAALLIALALAFGLIYWAWGSYLGGEVSYFPSATKLWVPQGLFALGPLFLSLSLLGRLVRLITREKAP